VIDILHDGLPFELSGIASVAPGEILGPFSVTETGRVELTYLDSGLEIFVHIEGYNGILNPFLIVKVDWHGDTEGEHVVASDIWGETEDTVMREFQSSIFKVNSSVDHEEWVFKINLCNTVSHLEGISHSETCEVVLVSNMSKNRPCEIDVLIFLPVVIIHTMRTASVPSAINTSNEGPLAICSQHEIDGVASNGTHPERNTVDDLFLHSLCVNIDQIIKDN